MRSHQSIRNPRDLAVSAGVAFVFVRTVILIWLARSGSWNPFSMQWPDIAYDILFFLFPFDLYSAFWITGAFYHCMHWRRGESPLFSSFYDRIWFWSGLLEFGALFVGAFPHYEGKGFILGLSAPLFGVACAGLQFWWS